MGMLIVRDTALYFQEVGRGDCLLFIHGMGGDANTWDEQTAVLCDDFRCVAYDRRGHTRSSVGAIAQPTVTDHANDAAELITALGLSPAIVVGLDHGSEISLDLACRYPGLVRGLALTEPLVNSLGSEDATAFWAPIIGAMQAAPTPQAGVGVFFAAVSRGGWERWPQTRRDAARSNHAALISSLCNTSSVWNLEDLQALKVPVQLISGALSPSLFRKTASMIAKHIPNVELISLAGARYPVNTDQPYAFNNKVRSFARQTESSLSRRGEES